MKYITSSRNSQRGFQETLQRLPQCVKCYPHYENSDTKGLQTQTIKRHIQLHHSRTKPNTPYHGAAFRIASPMTFRQPLADAAEQAHQGR